MFALFSLENRRREKDTEQKTEDRSLYFISAMDIVIYQVRVGMWRGLLRGLGGQEPSCYNKNGIAVFIFDTLLLMVLA